MGTSVDDHMKHRSTTHESETEHSCGSHRHKSHAPPRQPFNHTQGLPHDHKAVTPTRLSHTLLKAARQLHPGTFKAANTGVCIEVCTDGGSDTCQIITSTHDRLQDTWRCLLHWRTHRMQRRQLLCRHQCVVRRQALDLA